LLSTIDEIFPIIIIDEMYDLINIHDCDMVSGTRYKFGGKRYGGFFIGKNLSRLANLLFNFITNFPLSDSTTGFKMFKKKFFENIKIESRPIGWAFAFEMAIKFSIEGAKFGEVPLIAVDRVFGGKSTFKGNAKKWTPIKSSARGIVTLAEKDLYYTGGTIIMDHGHGISTIYSHLEDVLVVVGDQINQGDIIGTVGSTGRSTGPHLDFRINWFQTRLDPMSVIN
jgi:hypothetical protein